jgi:hypothetical protein
MAASVGTSIAGAGSLTGSGAGAQAESVNAAMVSAAKTKYSFFISSLLFKNSLNV